MDEGQHTQQDEFELSKTLGLGGCTGMGHGGIGCTVQHKLGQGRLGGRMSERVRVETGVVDRLVVVVVGCGLWVWVCR